MTKRKKPASRIFPKGSLARARADAAMRLAAGEYVASTDLGGGRTVTQAVPEPLVTTITVLHA